MKKFRIPLLIMVLLVSSLACQALAGNGTETEPQSLPPAENPQSQPGDSNPSTDGDSEYPMLSDASNVVNTAGVVNYQTQFSLTEVIEFYRDTLSSQGYTERSINTTITDVAFNLVFDGHPSGQALVIQGTDLGGGTVNVTIFLQDM
jgi:hypothetical protein